MTTYGQNVYDRATLRYERRANALSYGKGGYYVLVIEAVRLMHRLEDQGWRFISLAEKMSGSDQA